MRIIALLTILIASSTHAQAADKFDSREAGFVAIFPCKPTTDSREGRNILGSLRHDTVSAEYNGARYEISAEDLPVVPNLPAPQTRLKGMRDGVVGTDGKVLKEVEMPLGKRGDLGWSLLLERGAKRERVNIFLYGDRLYVVRVTGSKSAVESRDADKFFDSFQLK